MRQLICTLQLQQSFKIMCLIPLDAKAFHHMSDQLVIIHPYLVTDIFLRPEITRDTDLIHMRNLHTRRIVRHSLGDRDMRLKSLVSLAVKINKTSHGMEKPSCNRKPQSKTACQTAASRICLIKIIIHLRKLGIRHADPGIPDIYDQIASIMLLTEFDTDVDTAFLRKLDGILHQYLQYMRNLFRIPYENGRKPRINVKHHLQLAPAVLHRRDRKHIVQYGGESVFFLCRGKRAFHNLRIIKHVVDQVGQPSSGHLDGADIRKRLLGDFSLLEDLADPDHHIDRSPKLMRHIGQENGILLPRRLKLCKCLLVLPPCLPPLFDPIPRNRRRTCHYHRAKQQAHGHPVSRIQYNRMQDQDLIQHCQHVQSDRHT